MTQTIILSEEELKLLFPNQIKREIFIKGINRMINIINERSIHVPFVKLESSKID